MENIKKIVQEKYSLIVKNSNTNADQSCCSTIDYAVFADQYTGLQGYDSNADLGLGCGLPTEFAGIKKGDTVIDLGSGAGNDCFVARAISGNTGRIIGIDFTAEMIEKAKANARRLDYSNVEFILGDIENIPLENNTADVVISNCVINLVPNKVKVFAEIYRILNTGGHFCISDVVITGNMPEQIKQDALMYAGCVSGAIQKEDYLKIINDIGFKNVQIKKEKRIVLPNDILSKYISKQELDNINNLFGLFSITVYAEKY